MSKNEYLPSRKKPRHPALSDPRELERVMKRYNGSAKLASVSMGCSETTITKAMRALIPEFYESLIAQGKARGPKARTA